MCETRLIPLSNGGEAIVDADVYDFLMQWKWRKDDYGYVVRNTTVRGVRIQISMHRLVNKTPDGKICDHINRNKLDMRRENLRDVSFSDNMKNRDPGKQPSTGFTGVTYDPARDSFAAHYNPPSGPRKYVGHYPTAKKAAEERQKFIQTFNRRK